MNMEKAIKRAETAGYSSSNKFSLPWIESILTDPLFWKALSDAEKWSHQDKWKVNMHRFIDHLIAEKPIDDFFNNLLTNTQ